MRFIAAGVGPALAFTFLIAPQLRAERWALQYFYDQNREQLNIVDLAFPSAERGIAVGWIEEPEKKPRPMSLVTADGGSNWTPTPLKEPPRSLFFLNDSMGWMVTDDGIWFTEESGRSWRKIADQTKANPKLRPRMSGGLIMRVAFQDPQHGYAIGYQKTVLQTQDGGRTWTPLAEAAKPTANPAFTVYAQIAFDGPRGLIAGAAVPSRTAAFPAWMDPEAASARRQQPTLTLLLKTVDGGTTWGAENAPLFGVVRALRMSGPVGLAVFDFRDAFEWPSEVYRISLAGGGSTSVFRQKDRRVTDVALFPGSRAFLAAVEPPGRLPTLAIPGKVKMLTSANLTEWKAMDVDYRAVATSVTLAGPDPEHLWAATDTGMILKLSK